MERDMCAGGQSRVCWMRGDREPCLLYVRGHRAVSLGYEVKEGRVSWMRGDIEPCRLDVWGHRAVSLGCEGTEAVYTGAGDEQHC
eukprot:2203420-Rhodomonas_salina.1